MPSLAWVAAAPRQLLGTPLHMLLMPLTAVAHGTAHQSCICPKHTQCCFAVLQALAHGNVRLQLMSKLSFVQSSKAAGNKNQHSELQTQHDQLQSQHSKLQDQLSASKERSTKLERQLEESRR